MNDPAIVARAQGLTKRYGSVTALDAIDFELTENRIYGLLGRNGAGKTTLLQLLAGREPRTAGQLHVRGGDPFDAPAVRSGLCLVLESQRYPEDCKVRDVLGNAARLLPNWDGEFADRLLADFELPTNRRMKKLSRGMTSAVGAILGLASRAPVTLFDEPYLGLDAVARRIFYDRLLADYAEHPRTIMVSTHHIDEVSELIEHVLLIDRGRILFDRDADALREHATEIIGPATTLAEFVVGKTVLHRESLGSLARATVTGLTTDERTEAKAAGLDLSAVGLQQLMVLVTSARVEEASR